MTPRRGAVHSAGRIACRAAVHAAARVLNLINLSLSRILERSSEIGVRKAFGASSWTLVGQFLVESVVLTLIGGALGLALSALAIRMVGNADFIPYAQLSLNFRVFLYGHCVLTLVFGGAVRSLPGLAHVAPAPGRGACTGGRK